MAGKIEKINITVVCEFKGMKVIIMGANRRGGEGMEIESTLSTNAPGSRSDWANVEGTARQFILTEFEQTTAYKDAIEAIHNVLTFKR